MVGSDIIPSIARERKELASFVGNSPSETFYVRDGSEFREADDEEIFVRARELVAGRFRLDLPVLAEKYVVQTFLLLHMAPLEQMHFGVLFLNRWKRLIAFRGLFRGTVDSINVYPREIVREAVSLNAVHVILVKNDPSGEPTFSDIDKLTWARVRDALALVEIQILDYFLVGSRVTSCAEECSVTSSNWHD